MENETETEMRKEKSVKSYILHTNIEIPTHAMRTKIRRETDRDHNACQYSAQIEPVGLVPMHVWPPDARGPLVAMAAAERADAFITKLHAAALNATNKYLNFTPDGSGLLLPSIEHLNSVQHTSELLPLSLNQSNSVSELRQQLYRYGFSRDELGDGSSVYAHDSFHRDFPERLVLVQCISCGGNQAGPSGSGESSEGTAGFRCGFSAGASTSSGGSSSPHPSIQPTSPGISLHGGALSMEPIDANSMHELQTISASMRAMDHRIEKLSDLVKLV